MSTDTMAPAFPLEDSGALIHGLDADFELAGYDRHLTFVDHDVIVDQALDCESCGGAIVPAGFRHPELRVYRAFAYCSLCGRVAFEF